MAATVSIMKSPELVRDASISPSEIGIRVLIVNCSKGFATLSVAYSFLSLCLFLPGLFGRLTKDVTPPDGSLYPTAMPRPHAAR